jgi:TRAP-type C4-dicarboxylate transport system substrate-binding protein
MSRPSRRSWHEVTQEAAEKTTNDIRKREGELVDEFKKKGNNVVTVDRAPSSSTC